jgi:hypothetical protein
LYFKYSHNLYFNNRIDILFEGSRDFRGAFAVYAFQGYKEVLENIKANSLPRYLPVFEKVTFLDYL